MKVTWPPLLHIIHRPTLSEVMDFKSVIETDRSFLRIYSSTEYINLVKLCIDEVTNKLVDNPKIIMLGNEVTCRRSVGFFSDTSEGYYFAGKLTKSCTLTPHLTILLDKINVLFESNFNGILVNKYKDGTDYIGRHSDNEQYLGNSGVVAISYGSVRKFRIKNKITKEKVIDIPTISGSILHMGGDFQKEFTHEIPVEKKIKTERYSLTFRKHNR